MPKNRFKKYHHIKNIILYRKFITSSHEVKNKIYKILSQFKESVFFGQFTFKKYYYSPSINYY
jgi:hypothetical protein